jgi:hypothetical protein
VHISDRVPVVRGIEVLSMSRTRSLHLEVYKKALRPPKEYGVHTTDGSSFSP